MALRAGSVIQRRLPNKHRHLINFNYITQTFPTGHPLLSSTLFLIVYFDLARYARNHIKYANDELTLLEFRSKSPQT